MFKKRLLLFSSVACMFVAGAFFATEAMGKSKGNENVKALKRELELRSINDSLLSKVKIEDLLDDEVYQKLAYEGWTPEEIMQIMKSALADKSAARMKDGYVKYAKRWLPDYGLLPDGDSLYVVMDTSYTEAMRKSVERTVPEDVFNAYWEPLPYVPPKDRNERNPGYFRQPKLRPSVGRVKSAAVHPDEDKYDHIYVATDGGGLFKTENFGEHWDCISDRIPKRYDRVFSGYGIPVDPSDWNHLFTTTSTGFIYETFDGGESWEIVEGAKHKNFKRLFCFRDSQDKLKFIGCTRNGTWVGTQVWVSEDKGVTWQVFEFPNELKDTNPVTGERGAWFQEVCQDPDDHDIFYLPTSRSIFYIDNGARGEIIDGKNTFRLKKLHFEVYDLEGEERRYAEHPTDLGKDLDHTNDAIFPCPSNTPGNLIINALKPDQWWFVAGCGGCGVPNATALFTSEDHGKTWKTLHDMSTYRHPDQQRGVGAFGDGLNDGWLGAFGVNFKDPTYMAGAQISTGWSFDGGKTFKLLHWLHQLKSYQPHKRGWYYTSSGRAHGDNHYIVSHKSGRLYRCADFGLMCWDRSINPNDWINLHGDMSNSLFYWIAVNEFGDQVMFGNNQDCDAQTWRNINPEKYSEGVWGNWIGYEGSESWINPYTQMLYTAGLLTNQGFDESISLGSWRTASTKADVVTGAWFFTRGGSGVGGKSFNRCDDIGRSSISLEANMGEALGGVSGRFGLCRDKGRCTVYVVTRSAAIKRSIDGGNTFEPVLYKGNPAKFNGACIATDPDNSDIFYFSQTGHVYRFYVNEDKYEEVGTGLPQVSCAELFFHEGSGDLYYHSGSGFYILEYDKTSGQYAPQWRYWTKGYNIAKSSKAVINYTTQEMVIGDYGKAVWCADLEHPSDRFFSDGFKLKECSFKDGRHTIGIDTEWTIPLYYYFKWTVNGEEITDSPYLYLRRRLNPGDKVQLQLTLREAPDVKTLSEVFVVPTTGVAENGNEINPAKLPDGMRRTGESGGISYDNPVVKESGHAIWSSGSGRIDLGYFDYFFNDFTIDFWVNPSTDGSLFGNTSLYGNTKDKSRSCKGFEISIKAGQIQFSYFPFNVFAYPTYESAPTQSSTLTAPIQYSHWSHVAITHERYGNVSLYINGIKMATAKRIRPNGTLNNSAILSLFGDAVERNTMSATLDELKIWTRSLSEEDVRKEMYSTNAENSNGLAAYWSFNGGSLANDIEEFSRHGIKSRIRAQVRYPEMTVPTCAKSVIYEKIDNLQHLFRKGDMNVMGITPVSSPSSAPAANVADASDAPAKASAAKGSFGVYVYDATRWKNEEDNLDADFYVYQPVGYVIHAFDNIDLSDKINVDFYPCGSEFDPAANYRFYVADPNLDKQVWERVGTRESVTYNSAKNAITVSGITLADIVDKKLLIVTTLPGIEAKVTGMGDDGILPIYSESQSSIPLTANVLGGLPTPEGVYQLNGNGIILASGLQFANGKDEATGVLNLDLSKLGEFNTTVRATLRSDDNPIKEADGTTRSSLIPLTIDVRNRISPTEIGGGLKLDNATAEIGTATDYQSVLLQPNFTIMGWVRIDDPLVIKTGNYSLMAWRNETNNKVTGLALNNGKLMAVVNNISLPESSLALTEDDLGNWVHVTVTVSGSPRKVTYYKNGIFDAKPKATFPVEDIGPFCLGKNSAIGTSSNADNFSGAFDQICVWSRAIAQDEVFKYMYSAVPVNDPGLLLFTNMDYKDRMGIRRDCFNNAEIKVSPTHNLNGSASFDETTYFPYEARTQSQWNDTEAVVSLKYNNTKNSTRYAVVSTFRGTPFNYENPSYSDYVPLSKEYYSITFLPVASSMYGDAITITYRNPIIMEGDKLAVGIRRIGTTENMSTFVHGISPENGIVVFDIPSSYLEYSSEIMFFMYPIDGDPTGGRLANVRLSFAPEIASKFTYGEDGVPELMLEENMMSIPIIAGVIGEGRYHEDISMELKQAKEDKNNVKFASCELDELDFTQPTIPLTINLDRSKINRFGKNELYIDIDGVYTKDPLKLRFYIKPYVHLSLKNGEHGNVVTPPDYPGVSTDPEDPDPFDPEVPDPEDTDYGPMESRRRSPRAGDGETADEKNNTFTTPTPIASLQISAELVEGYLPDGSSVELEVVSGLPTSLNIGHGSLLEGQTVTIDGLGYLESTGGAFHEGWNLVGNPYLTNINLTNGRNVNYDPDLVTKFIYHCNPETGNYEVHDMTTYNAEHKISPFQSYFVQTTANNASLGITPVAKEAAPTKKTMVYNVTEKQELVLALEADGKTYDHVTIVYDDNANNNFKPNEDAAKLWNVDGSSPELVAFSADDKPVTITTVNSSSPEDVALGVKSDVENRHMQLRCLALTGFDGSVIKIHDNMTGEDWNPALNGNTYQFTAMSGTGGSGEEGVSTLSNSDTNLYNSNRFTVSKTTIQTGMQSVEDAGYRIYVEEHTCIVTGLKGDAIVTIFTSNGMKIAMTQTAESTYRTNLESGVYIVTIRENGKDYTSKIMVR